MGQEKKDSLARARYHLYGWGEWVRTNRGQVSRGFQHQSVGISSGRVSSTLEDLVEVQDARAARVSDEVVDGLPYLYRVALQSEYVLQGTVKHNRRSTQELLEDAELAFWNKARKWLV